MQVGEGEHSYSWIENWARIPDSAIGRANGRTHGVEVSASGDVIVFHQSSPAVLIFDPDGRLKSAWGNGLAGAHGLTLTAENGEEFLWLTDQETAQVVKTTVAGRPVRGLPTPPLDIYAGGGYVPTWVAVNEPARGGNGDVWVADGYGKSYVHRFDAAGNYVSSINGSEGRAGAFKCPHGIFFDWRRGRAELYIADRGNRRVQVYDAEGRFLRAFGQDFLTSPCSFATHGELLLVPELRARVTLLDGDDRPVCHLGSNEPVCDVKGWPNHPPELVQPGKFNSPHDLAADPAGNLYVVEWKIGGRITKLERT